MNRGVDIFPGDYLVVDRSLKPREGDVVIADLEGQHQVRKLLTKVRPRLMADSGDAVFIDEESVTIIGVVVTAVKPLHDPRASKASNEGTGVWPGWSG